MSTGTQRKERLIRMIGEGLVGIRREIEKAKAGAEALDSLRQLLFIEAKLLEMQQILQRDDWRSCPMSKPGIARLVVDSWPLDNALGNLLVEIEYEYGRLK